jgi:hypothetical protein
MRTFTLLSTVLLVGCVLLAALGSSSRYPGPEWTTVTEGVYAIHFILDGMDCVVVSNGNSGFATSCVKGKV